MFGDVVRRAWAIGFVLGILSIVMGVLSAVWYMQETPSQANYCRMTFMSPSYAEMSVSSAYAHKYKVGDSSLGMGRLS